MSTINIINNNTINRSSDFEKNIVKNTNIPLKLYKELYLNNNCKKNNIVNYIDVKYIELNNKNSFNYNFYKNLEEKINNIHFIGISKIIIPKYISLNKYKYNNNQIEDYFLNNLNLNKGNDYNYNNEIININNKTIIQTKIIYNYSLNKNYDINYEIIILNNIVIEHNIYELNKLLNTEDYYPYINLSIDNIQDEYFNSTNEIKIYNNLLPKNKINNIYYDNKKCDIVYPLSKLKSITKININLLDNKNQKIFKNIETNYDNEYEIVNRCNCIYINNKTGCECSYIRNKNNYISTIILRLGIIKPDIISKLIN